MSRPATMPPSLLRAPFRGSEAIGAGLLTLAQLRSPHWRRIFHDVYVNAKLADTHILRVRGAVLRLPPRAVISGRSAAHLWGAELAAPSDPVEILTPTKIRASGGLSVRQGRVADDERVLLRRIPVTTPVHSAWEIARALPPLDAIAWIDALARARRLTTRDLVDHALRHEGEFGSRIARDTLALSDPRAESPPESRLRVHLRLAGLPAPIPQWSVYESGVFIARVDLAWPELKFAIEYDGRWHADPDQLARDRARIRKLNAAGWYVYPVTARDMHDISGLIRHLASVLAERTAIVEPA